MLKIAYCFYKMWTFRKYVFLLRFYVLITFFSITFLKPLVLHKLIIKCVAQIDYKVCYYFIFLFECKFEIVKTVSKRMFLINDLCTTFSGLLFAICMFIFLKTEVLTVILRCLTGLHFDYFQSYDTKRKYFHFCLFCNFVPFTFFAFFEFLCFVS